MVDKELKLLALDLLDIGAMNFGTFRWKYHEKNPDAPLAPIYTNLRILRSYPKTIRRVARVLKCFIIEHGLKPDLLVDIPTAATPIVSILMEKTGIPMISPRKDEKKYGIYTKVEGTFRPGQTVLLIDDVVSFADSKFEVMQPLFDKGLVVKDILVLIDNELGGSQELEEAGIRLWSVYKISELLDFYCLEAQRLSSEEYYRILASFDKIRDYFKFKRAH